MVNPEDKQSFRVLSTKPTGQRLRFRVVGCVYFLGDAGCGHRLREPTAEFSQKRHLDCYTYGLMAAIHQQAAAPKRIWSLLGAVFAVIYAVLVDIVYYVQLVVTKIGVGGAAINTGVAAGGVSASASALQQFTYTPGTAFFALDMLGYGFMCLSTWLAAYSFSGRDSLTTWIRRLFILHGVMVLPTLVAPALMAGGAGTAGGAAGAAAAGGAGDKFGYIALLFWCAIFIPLTLTVIRYFRLRMRAGVKAGA